MLVEGVMWEYRRKLWRGGWRREGVMVHLLLLLLVVVLLHGGPVPGLCCYGLMIMLGLVLNGGNSRGRRGRRCCCGEKGNSLVVDSPWREPSLVLIPLCPIPHRDPKRAP